MNLVHATYKVPYSLKLYKKLVVAETLVTRLLPQLTRTVVVVIVDFGDLDTFIEVFIYVIRVIAMGNLCHMLI